MIEEYFDKGSTIIGSGEECTSIMFVVYGKIELIIPDNRGEKHILRTLIQGDMLGQYSTLFNKSFVFSAIAKTNVRLLTIDRSFFLDYRDVIKDVDDAVYQAELFTEKFGTPTCDFKIFDDEVLKPSHKLKRAYDHLKILNRLNKNAKNKFFSLVNEIT